MLIRLRADEPIPAHVGVKFDGATYLATRDQGDTWFALTEAEVRAGETFWAWIPAVPIDARVQA